MLMKISIASPTGLRRLRELAGVGLVLTSLGAHAHRPWLLPSATVVEGSMPMVTIDAATSEDLFEFDAFALQLDALHVTAPDGTEVTPDARQEGKRRISFDLKLAQK